MSTDSEENKSLQLDDHSEAGDLESHHSEAPSQAPEYAMAVEQFRGNFYTAASAKALERIRVELKENENADTQIIRFITEGSAQFNSSLYAFWNNLAVITVFLGIVSASIAVSFTGRMGGFDDAKVISSDSYEAASKAYYVLWAISAVVQFISLALVLLTSSHYRFMLHEDDMVWFLITWGFYACRLPVLLTVIGVLLAIAGIVLGVILTSDAMVTGVVAGFSGLLLILLAFLWMCMNAYNKDREQVALERIRHALLKKKT